MNFIFHFGRYVLLLKGLFTRPENYNMYWKSLMREMVNIGIGSLTIVSIISLFIGAVTAVQFAYQLQGNGLIPTYYLAFIVRDSMIIEMAPTISCIILAGKVGSNMASELGSMRISEQIDALDIMGVNSSSYLITPKILASLFVIPILVIFSAFLGILGGYIAGVFGGLITAQEYTQGLLAFFVPFNVTMMLIKAAVFAFLLTTISCYQGYYVNGGALELGKASTRAVVYSCILILASDYLLAELMT